MLVTQLPLDSECDACDGEGFVVHDGEPYTCKVCHGLGVFEYDEQRGPAVRIGGRVYPSVAYALGRFRLVRRSTRNPLARLLCAAVVLELKGMRW